MSQILKTVGIIVIFGPRRIGTRAVVGHGKCDSGMVPANWACSRSRKHKLKQNARTRREGVSGKQGEKEENWPRLKVKQEQRPREVHATRKKRMNEDEQRERIKKRDGAREADQK